MTRPNGVTASAIVCFLGSAFTLFVAVVTLAASQAPELVVEGLGREVIIGAVVLGGLAALGIATGIGLLRLRPWARVSMLVFSGVAGALSVLTGVVMLFVPLPQSDPSVAGLRPMLSGMYLVPAAISIAWLVYFTRQGTIAAFDAGASSTLAPSRRPLGISIIGWFYVVAAFACILPAAMGMPGFFIGWTVTGWGAVLYFVLIGAITGYLGRGLLALDERSRIGAIAWNLYSLAQTAVVYLIPSVKQRWRDYNTSMGNAPDVSMGASYETFETLTMVLGIAVIVLVLVVLMRSKPAFQNVTPPTPPDAP